MSYIAPNGTILLLEDVPLDNTYRNTLYWSRNEDLSGVADQERYFISKARYTFSNQSYSRPDINKIRLRVDVGNVYGCNYLMFKNEGSDSLHGKVYENKWFYAFITSINYINNSVTEIEYELDIMQTWYFNYRRKQCMVERETVAHDGIFQHTLPEDVEGAEYTVNKVQPTDLGRLYAVIAMAFNPTDPEIQGSFAGLFDGVITGCDYKVAPTFNEFSDLIKSFTEEQNEHSVVSIYMFPEKFFVNDGVPALPERLDPDPTFSRPSKLDGYTPRNKKLYSYPYNYIEVSDNASVSMDYKYEWFYYLNASNEPVYVTPSFSIYGTAVNSPQIAVTPINYKNSKDKYPTRTSAMTSENFDETMVITDFPQTAYTIDTYRAWIASGGRFENRLQVANNIVSGIGTIAGLTAGGVSAMGGASSGYNVVTGLLHNWKTGDVMAKKGNTSKGNNSSDIMTCLNRKGVYFYNKCLKNEYLKAIDDYFDLYGYSVMQLKMPEFNNRKEWTYVKTAGFDAWSHLPADDFNKICSIFDNGITFWNDPNHVGNYNLINGEY